MAGFYQGKERKINYKGAVFVLHRARESGQMVMGSVCGRLETRKRRPTGGAELLIFSRKRGIKKWSWARGRLVSGKEKKILRLSLPPIFKNAKILFRLQNWSLNFLFL